MNDWPDYDSLFVLMTGWGNEGLVTAATPAAPGFSRSWGRRKPLEMLIEPWDLLSWQGTQPGHGSLCILP